MEDSGIKAFRIDNVSNYSSSEEQIVTICDAQQIAFEKLLFATKQGMIKRVDGSEFQVAKRTIAATKLQEEDALIHVGWFRRIRILCCRQEMDIS